MNTARIQTQRPVQHRKTGRGQTVKPFGQHVEGQIRSGREITSPGPSSRLPGFGYSLVIVIPFGTQFSHGNQRKLAP